MMVAISSRSPRATALLDGAAHLAQQLQAEWFVVHVTNPPTPQRRSSTIEHPVPVRDLEYARSLGARVIIEGMRGNLAHTLVIFARTMGIEYFVTGRSKRSLFGFKWSAPLTEQIQRDLPKTTILIV
jgi:two-component system sensor histidine kinase KdpD